MVETPIARDGVLQNRRKEAVERYIAGEPPRLLYKEYGFRPSSLWRWAKMEGISFPGRTSRRYSVNEAAFSELTPESIYWIGFLMADGNIHDNVIHLGLQQADEGHVVKFKEFLNSSHPIIRKINRQKPKKNGGDVIGCCLQIHSKRIEADLAKYGFLANKSKTASCPILMWDRDFWRGQIDGDGHISDRDIGIIGTCGSYPMMQQFSEFARKTCPGVKANVTKIATIYEVRIHGRYARKMAAFLYDDAPVFLDRKMAIAGRLSMLYNRHNSL